MARPIIIAETPNAGAAGRGLLSSKEGLSEREAAAFVGCVKQAEAAGANYLGVRKMVMRRSTGDEAPAILVLAGIDVASLDEGTRADLLKKLKSCLPEVEYAAQQVDWAGEARRVVPSYELAGLIDAEIAGLPPADAAAPRGGTRSAGVAIESDGGSSGMGKWFAIAAGAVVLIGVVATVIALNQPDPDKQAKGPPKPDEKGRVRPKDLPPTPAERVEALRQRAESARDEAALADIEKEAAGHRADPEFAGQKEGLDAVDGAIAKRRDGLARAAADAKEAERKERLARDARAWPGTEDRVRELGRDEKYMEAARALGHPNEAYPKEWDLLRDWLATEVRLQLTAKAKKLARDEQFDEAREAIREMSRPELASLDPGIGKAASAASAALDPPEDRYRYDELREAPEAQREKMLRAYLNSPVRRKRGAHQAALALRWLQGDWPRSVPLEAALEADGKAKEGETFTLSLAADGMREPAVRTLKAGKGGVVEPARVSFSGRPGLDLTVRAGKEGGVTFPLGRFYVEPSMTVAGLRLTVAGLGPLPRYDDLPPLPTGE